MKQKKELRVEFNKDCSIRKAIGIIGQKHSILIFNELLKHGVLRFGELKKVLGNLNTGSLTTTLKLLEESDLIKRKAYNEIPPKVEYSLSPKGKELEKVLVQLQLWYEKWYKK